MKSGTWTVTAAVLTGLLALHGCTTPAQKPDPDGEVETAAEQLINDGHFVLAAEEFERLAQLYPKRRDQYRLRAAGAYLDAENAAETERVLSIVNVDEDSNDAVHYSLLRAGVALLRGAPQDSLSLSALSLPADAPDALRRLQHRFRAGAFEALGNHRAAVGERIALSGYLDEPWAREDNDRRLWESLNHLDEKALRDMRGAAGKDLVGWIDLALISQSLLARPQELRQALTLWEQQYVSHAARETIVGELLRLGEGFDVRPNQVALLLPFSGQYKSASEAIRDGFIAAWHESSDYQPTVMIYDTDALNVGDRYRTAIADGADFVVGPLEKSAVSQLAGEEEIGVMTLALNQLDTESGAARTRTRNGIPLLIQFGLPPEDEAREVARRAWFDGYTRALVIQPDNEWGARLYEAFAAQWSELGGEIIERVRYAPGTQDYATPVKDLLNIDSSEFRARKLREMLGRRLQTGARLRKDADMIFMQAVPVSARQIMPQFRFFLADQIPVYASSHAYSGRPDPQIDIDLNDVRFPDMPAVLRQPWEGTPVEQKLARNWSVESSPFRRLYALGADAFRIIPHLGRLALEKGASFNGLTGQLQMDDQGRIHRRLSWAQFEGGTPHLVDAPPGR